MFFLAYWNKWPIIFTIKAFSTSNQIKAMKPFDTLQARALESLSLVAGLSTALSTLYFFAANMLF
jgi:hypothetical protein